MEWHGYIADGHNRYSICQKHNIEPVIIRNVFSETPAIIESLSSVVGLRFLVVLN